MKHPELKLPSNRSFGLFFGSVCLVACVYSLVSNGSTLPYIFASAAVVFYVVTLVKAELLLPLNKAWMLFGWLLGKIISPLVLGIIFFGLFTPIAFLMRRAGRDELRLHFAKKSTHWIPRETPGRIGTFKNQF